MTELTQPAAPTDVPPPASPATPPPTPTTRRRSIAAWLGLLAVVVGAVVGSNAFSIRDELFGSAVPKPAPVAGSRNGFSPIEQGAPTRTKLRSQPWWQDLTTLKGTGSARSSAFTVAGSAIQWRLRPRCASGRIVVRVPGRATPLVDTTCAGAAVTEASGTGAMRLDVQSDGPWRLEVSQQIDAPLVEPPRPAMTAAGASKVATARFYNVDKTGKGTATVYRQADGRYALRLERFFVTPTSDLELRLSTHSAPRTTRDYTSARSRLVAMMDVTAGSLNYSVAPGVDPTRFKSIVIWCAATANVYAAAGLITTR